MADWTKPRDYVAGLDLPPEADDTANLYDLWCRTLERRILRITLRDGFEELPNGKLRIKRPPPFEIK